MAEQLPKSASRRNPDGGIPQVDALSQSALARAIGVSPRRINEIVLAKRAITADSDLRLARYFGVSDGFFLQLQTDCDLMAQRRKISSVLKTIKPRAA